MGLRVTNGPLQVLLSTLGIGLLACSGEGAAHPTFRPATERHFEPVAVERASLPEASATIAAARRAAWTSCHKGAPMVVLVALDGARWHEVFTGVESKRAKAAGVPRDTSAAELMPNLHRIIRSEGAALGAPGVGEPISASGPNYVSLPGYIEMLSGRHETECTSNECGVSRFRSLPDDFAVCGEVAVVSSWPPIARAVGTNEAALVSAGKSALRGTLKGTRANALFEQGQRGAPEPGYGDYRADQYTAPLALEILRETRPSFLFVGLGDTDEHAHHNDYPGYLDALRAADRTIGEIDAVLTEQRLTGRETLLLVTSDHGRSHNFSDHGDSKESARVWLVAAGSRVYARGMVAAPEPRYLADLAPSVRAVAGLPPSPDEQGRVLSELFATEDL